MPDCNTVLHHRLIVLSRRQSDLTYIKLRRRCASGDRVPDNPAVCNRCKVRPGIDNVQYFDDTGNMKPETAAERLASLGQETRLAIFRLLVQAGAKGLSAGSICEKVGIPAPTLSFHLAHLSRVGLISGRQESRFIFYAADYAAMDDLLSYLTDNCCQGGQCLPKTAGSAAPGRRRRAASSR